jgi:ABC-type branched-subunit amino acid transport system ATPase component
MSAVAGSLMAEVKILTKNQSTFRNDLCLKILALISVNQSEDTTLLLVEKNNQYALSIAEFIYVIKNCVFSFEDTCQKLLRDERLAKA